MKFPSGPSQQQDRYILRFERPGQRDELKRQAAQAKRTLNKHLLHLIEAAQQREQEERNANQS